MKKLLRTKPCIPKDDHAHILERWADILETGMLVQGKYISEWCNPWYDKDREQE